jgi:hypothetical protein
MPALTNANLRKRTRRLEELSRLFTIEESLFKYCDVVIGVQLHFTDRQAYRDALDRAIRAFGEARATLVAVVQRPPSRQQA